MFDKILNTTLRMEMLMVISKNVLNDMLTVFLVNLKNSMTKANDYIVLVSFLLTLNIFHIIQNITLVFLRLYVRQKALQLPFYFFFSFLSVFLYGLAETFYLCFSRLFRRTCVTSARVISLDTLEKKSANNETFQ